MPANVERLDEAIREVVSRGFEIELHIDNNGCCEFAISGSRAGSGHTVCCNSLDGNAGMTSVPMRIIEELLILDGKV